MELPININISIKQKTLKEGTNGQEIALELAYSELMAKLRKMNLITVESNAFEITAKLDIAIIKRLKVV